MEKKNKKRSKKKIAAIVCLVLVVLVAGVAVSAYSVFKMKFYDKSNYVKHGTYVAAANTEKKAKEGEKQDAEVRTATEVSHSSAAAQKIHNTSATGSTTVSVSSSVPETERKGNSASSSSVQKTTEKKESSMLEKMAKQFFSQKDTYNLLLLGVDRRDESWNGNSDVVLLVTVNKEKKTVYLTSFLRDLYADIPGVGVRKLNAACANGGPELTIQTLEENYHVEIDNYAMVDFNAMIDVVDALGGVDLEIDEDERVTANDYITCMCEDNGVDPKPYYIKKAGKVHLNGYQAVGYARNRYTGKGSDFGRTQRQRNVLLAIAEKAQNGDFASLSDTIEDVMPYITHDIPEFEMIGLIMQIGTWMN